MNELVLGRKGLGAYKHTSVKHDLGRTMEPLSIDEDRGSVGRYGRSVDQERTERRKDGSNIAVRRFGGLAAAGSEKYILHPLTDWAEYQADPRLRVRISTAASVTCTCLGRRGTRENRGNEKRGDIGAGSRGRGSERTRLRPVDEYLNR